MAGIIYLAIMVLMIVGMWKVATKAGKPGWTMLVPIYNIFILNEIAGKPVHIILYFLPVINIYAQYKMAMGLAEKFGQSSGFGWGLLLLGMIFYPIIGFGGAKYQAQTAAVPAPPAQ